MSDSSAPLPAASGHGQNREALQQQLADILQRIAGADPATIKPEARLIEDIGVDSLGFYEILIEADEHLGLKIEEKDLLGFRTVGDILDYLESRLDEAA